ncbi:MAG: SHOCT domain-containing protein [Saprospiraceae bacterium]|nr:SHOCT domain-containing protein [Saprospiraceae bacterium]
MRTLQIFSPGKFYPLITLFDMIEQEKSLKKAMNQEEKKYKASEIIKTHVGYSLGAALVPFPGADLLAVSAVQLNMLRQLAKLYQVGFMDVLGKNIISAVVGSSAARLGASLVKAIPGVGTIIGELSMPVLSGASTWALGRVVSNHFQNGGTLEDLDVTKAKKSYETEVEEGKKVAESMTHTNQTPIDETDITLDKLRKLAEMKDAGIITEEEFKELKARLLAQI